jgi:hypothetical protein
MTIIKEYNTNNYLDKLEFNKKLNVAEYFDYIYSYPPKIKVKWNFVDDLQDDYFIGSNYGAKKSDNSTNEFVKDWVFINNSEEAINTNYSMSEYVDGFQNKINSSNFFLKKTGNIQKALANVQVFAILNGQGEIVLSKPSNLLGSKNFKTYLNEQTYDLCGSFDSRVEKKSKLGLFFMTYLEAEKYLKEIAKADIEGTQTVSLSIHSISLESAYKITREYHPGIDFRFVPNYAEVKKLLVKSIGKSDHLVVEDEQQQLRYRNRSINFFPFLGKVGNYFLPSLSFLQRNEYFKGVPIYIVQLTEKPRNFWSEQYFNIIGRFDVMYSRLIDYFDYTAGFGHSWIMQGSLKKAGNSDKFENYIFFEKDQAIKFAKQKGRKVSRLSGGRTSTLQFMVRKPKVMVYNLEDFLEDWEDNIAVQVSNNKNEVKTPFNCKATYFISPDALFDENENLSSNVPLKKVSHLLNVKFRVLKRTIGVFFSI